MHIFAVVAHDARNIQSGAVVALAESAAVARRNMHDVLFAIENVLNHAVEDFGVCGAHLRRSALSVDQGEPLGMFLERFVGAQVEGVEPTVPEYRRAHPAEAVAAGPFAGLGIEGLGVINAGIAQPHVANFKGECFPANSNGE